MLGSKDQYRFSLVRFRILFNLCKIQVSQWIKIRSFQIGMRNFACSHITLIAVSNLCYRSTVSQDSTTQKIYTCFLEQGLLERLTNLRELESYHKSFL